MKIIQYVPREDRRNWARQQEAKAPTHFIGVDGEGEEKGGEHLYVLLGCGQKQIENPAGLGYEEIFSFLYSCYEENPRSAFVGFYLGYDFNQWLKTIPAAKAVMLLTTEGQAARKSRNKNQARPFPVMLGEWEIDIIPMKRFALRKIVHGRDSWQCKDHEHTPWMYICDAGSFWQTSFLNTINPKNWNDPIISQEEYDLISHGKDARGTATLDDDMRRYNKLENEVLARAMTTLDKGFREAGIYLRKYQWFGPGQAAQTWLKKQGIPDRHKLVNVIPKWFMDAARDSYIAGWFEITCHGIIPGVSHEYDLNSAYPYILASLPCLQHGNYERGDNDKPPLHNKYTLVYGYVEGSNPYLGAMLHRNREGGITRPHRTRGWFWLYEIQAAQKAGLISETHFTKWVSYYPCDCEPPLAGLRDLYELRLKMGKNSAMGKGSKLVYNSAYGKFAQTAGLASGGAPYNNWIYASLTTSGTRTLILDAIGSHPNGPKDTLMIATDGVYFRTEHPSLHISETELGAWDHKTKENLTLFKPGVYWDDRAREALVRGDAPAFKARGVSARDFAKQILAIDEMYKKWNDGPIPGENIEETQYANHMTAYSLSWPSIEFETEFSMISGLQAIRMNNWNFAGFIFKRTAIQSSLPEKRVGLYREDGLFRSNPLDTKQVDSVPYDKKYGMDDPFGWEYRDAMGLNPDGESVGDILNNLRRIMTGEET